MVRIMSRKKITPFKEWETTKENGIEKRYIRIGSTKLARMTELSPSAFKVFVCMCMESAGKETFEFPYSKYKDYMAKNTFKKVKAELIAAGYIEEVQNNQNLRKPNVYRFATGWKRSADKNRSEWL